MIVQLPLDPTILKWSCELCSQGNFIWADMDEESETVNTEQEDEGELKIQKKKKKFKCDEEYLF